MAELMIETAIICATADHFETKVESSKGGKTYRVAFEELSPRMKAKVCATHDWTCSCPSFKFRGGPCKHIEQVKAEGRRCGWNRYLEPHVEPATDSDGEMCCPDCGGPVIAVRVGV
jgi:hypothetical protein